MTDGLFVHEVTVPGCAVLSVRGELDIVSAHVVRARIAELVAAGHRRLVVDLAALEFIDAFGVRVLLGAAAQARERGGWLRLIGASPRIRRILHVLRLTERLPLFRTLDEALGAPPQHYASGLVNPSVAG